MNNNVIQKKKTAISLLLTTALVLGSFTFLPGKAYAASASDIAVDDYIDIGKTDAPGYTGTPHWRVIDKAEDGSMLLMSEYLWTGNGSDASFKPRFINDTSGAGAAKVINDQVVYWRGTDAEIWCDNFEEAVLGDAAGLTVRPTTKKVDAAFIYETTIYGDNNKKVAFAATDPMNSVLYENDVFFLSAEEAAKYIPDPEKRKAHLPDSEECIQWLLRSSPETPANWASEVKPDGELTSVRANTGRAARPVFWAEFDEDVDFVETTDESGARTWTVSEEQIEPEDTAVAEVVDKINALPAADKVTTADKEKIEEARKAYDALTDEQKADIDDETLAKLTEAEKALAEAQKAEEKAAGEKAAAQKAAEEKAKATTSVTVNARTVNDRTVNDAIAAAGGKTEYVTEIVIGKGVKKISRNAFKGTKVNTLIVKSKKLTKKSVKGSLKGSVVKTVKVKVGKAKANKEYVKKYKKIFTKKNAGRKVKVRK